MKSKIKLEEGELRVGEISGLHGVHGWVKVFSDTQPRENIFKYQPWHLYGSQGITKVDVAQWRKQGKTLVAQIVGLEDREQARALIGSTIAIDSAQLPKLDNGEFYWSQLIGLRVKTSTSVDIGVVKHLIETGSNDVLVVQGDGQSLDQDERLIPWAPDQFVLNVDLQSGEIQVDWDPEF